MQAAKARFSLTKIMIDDLDKPAAFYKTVFGMSEYAHIKDAVTPERPIEEIMLALTDELISRTTTGALQVPQRAGAQGQRQHPGIHRTRREGRCGTRQAGAGGGMVRAPEDQPVHGVRVAFVTDCDDRRIEIVQMLAGS